MALLRLGCALICWRHLKSLRYEFSEAEAEAEAEVDVGWVLGGIGETGGSVVILVCSSGHESMV